VVVKKKLNRKLYTKISPGATLLWLLLQLPSTVKIYPVVNVSRIHKYIGQVEGQKKKQPAPVMIEGEEE